MLWDTNNPITFQGSDSEGESTLDPKKGQDYHPAVNFQRQLLKKPDTVSLEKVLTKSILKETTATALMYNLSSTAQFAMVASTLKAAGADFDDMTLSQPSALRHISKEQES